MAQLAKPKLNIAQNQANGLCPFYGSSHGCPYKNECTLSHLKPNSIELCPSYQTASGCTNPSACYYRHSLRPLTEDEQQKLAKTHKIAGKIHYARVIKGASVHRVIIVINQVLWFGIHFIIEDARLQKVHYQKYSSIYYWCDALLVSELIADIVTKSKCPGKYLSYLKNVIDGDTEAGCDENRNKNAALIHYRDILSSIGNDFNAIPKPINPHLVCNISRVPWIDFKLLPLSNTKVYEYPEVYLVAGDLVRVWRPKKFVYHCGIYAGNKKIIHISNGVQGDDGLNWRISGLFQSGKYDAAAHKKYYDYGKKMKSSKQKEEDECKKIELEKTEENIGEIEAFDEKESALIYEESEMSAKEMEFARRARECEWKEFVAGSRAKDLELGFFIFPWRKSAQIVYTAMFLTEIHYMKGQYSVYKNNCEHFALYCCTGLRYSPQANTLEKVMNVSSKISAFAGSILSKATLFRKKEIKNAKDEESEAEAQHRRQHPVIQSQILDDGGDDDLERILLKDNNNNKCVKKKKKTVKKKWIHKSKKEDVILNNDDMLIDDEYADDDEDIMIQNDRNVFDASHMTPGGFTKSEVLVAQKHQIK